MVCLSSSSTRLFYHLLDLSHDKQQDTLSALKKIHPDTYQEINALLKISESDPIADLWHFHAQHTFHSEWDFSHKKIDKYQTTEELGRGGMGIVYSATRSNGTFEQDLAIKFIQPHFNHLLHKQALFKEAQLLACLNHPYIAKVFDGGEHEGCVYIVMEKVIGMTLNEYLETHELSYQQKLQLCSQLCQALEHAHHLGVLHGDLTPENILVDQQGLPKLIDFNLTQNAFIHDMSDKPSLTAYNETFASPEQKEGHPLTPLSDVYSLGKILQLLFFDTNLKNDIAFIFKKATQPTLMERYASVKALQKDIESVLAYRPISLKKHQLIYTISCLLKRKPMTCFLSAFSLFISVTFSTMLIIKNHQLQQEKKVAASIMCEMTQLIFESTSSTLSHRTMLEITRHRILSNPNLPIHIKQKMLMPMMPPLLQEK